MHKRALLFAISILLSAALSGCGGGSGSGNAVPPAPNNGGGPGTQTQDIVKQDLFNLNNSDLLDTLEVDQGFTVTSIATPPTSFLSSTRKPMTAGPFAMQITGGNATIARNGSSTSPAIGFLITFRDPSGLCECAEPLLPYKATLSNAQWHASPFGTLASTTTLGIGMKNNTDSADHGGIYTATVANPPGGSAQFSIAHPTWGLGRQSTPSINVSGGNLNVTWTPVAGSKTYFVAFLTHLANDPIHNPAFNIVGFVITDKNTVSVPLSQFYSKAQYQLLMIDSDTRYIPVYTSQGVDQLPVLPAQIDFSVSQILTFNTP